MITLLDNDIEHIRSVLRRSLNGVEENPILTSPYWRRRLVSIMRMNQLSVAQLTQIDALLTILNQFVLAQACHATS